MQALINGCPLEYDDTGAGPVVLLIHGFPLNRRMWRPQVEGLAAAGYRVITPDLPGFGASGLMLESETMDRYADSLIGLLDYLFIDKAVVGGMSMGGYVLLDLLERYPERVSAAMFLVTRAAADDEAGKAKRSELIAQVESGELQAVPDAFAQVLFAPHIPRQKPEIVAEVRAWMEETDPRGVIGGLAAMRDRKDYLAGLGQFDLPCLVVGAEQDLAVPVPHAEALVDGLPNTRLCVISEAGHMVNLEKPEMFNRCLVEFLASLK